jgi:hypothetical protein
VKITKPFYLGCLTPIFILGAGALRRDADCHRVLECLTATATGRITRTTAVDSAASRKSRASPSA